VVGGGANIVGAVGGGTVEVVEGDVVRVIVVVEGAPCELVVSDEVFGLDSRVLESEPWSPPAGAQAPNDTAAATAKMTRR